MDSQKQKKTQDQLDRYVSARRNQTTPQTVKTLRWGRLALTLAALGGLVALSLVLVLR